MYIIRLIFYTFIIGVFYVKKLLDTIVPKFTRLPLFLVLSSNFIVYYLTLFLLPENINRYDLSLSIDEQIPTIPFFVLIYVLAFVQWVASYVLHSRDNELTCYKVTTAGIIAKLICLIFFIALPTVITIPEVTGNGFFEWGTRFIHSADRPYNLFPSIHCLESWLCFRGAMMLKNKNYYYITSQGIFTILVFASTIFIKQHFIVDIPAGILVCEIGLFLSRRAKGYRIMEKINNSIIKSK